MVTVIVGAQYGSEGKGNIVAKLAHRFTMHVRTGGPNAGHSLIYNGKIYKMQVIPCGWVNPEAALVLARGAIVSPTLLIKEINMLEDMGTIIKDRLFIDGNASVLTKEHQIDEGGTKGDLHRKIGSTGEGVGVCRTERMARYLNSHMLARDCDALQPYIYDDVTDMYIGHNVLLEGTQGTGLSLVHGHWPYVTSADTTAGQFLVDAGLPWNKVSEVILVARTYPIRVAGNSGPLNQEIDWSDISNKFGREIVEKTTVTNKIRRIGMWDEDLFKKACRLNGPTYIALTFVDYLNPDDEGQTDRSELSSMTRQFIKGVEAVSRCPVSLIGTGGPNWTVIGA